MILLKKLILAPVFLILFAFLIYQLPQIFKSYDFIFSLSSQTFIQLISLSALICASSFSFILFASLSLDWKLVLPVAILASFLPMLFFEVQMGLLFSVGNLVILLLTFTSLENTMKSYLTFKPFSILGPSIRLLSTLLIMVICVIYFFSINKTISEKGFQIPDSLIDAALKFAPQAQPGEQTELPQLSSDQIDLLRKNPDLLRQSGLNPKILDTLNSQKTQNISNDLIKQTVKDQVDSFLKPYLSFIPALLAILLFLTFQGITSLVNLLIYPLLWITFLILEKTGFVKFIEETRIVKKLIL